MKTKADFIKPDGKCDYAARDQYIVTHCAAFTAAEIAKSFGITYQRVVQIRDRFNVPLNERSVVARTAAGATRSATIKEKNKQRVGKEIRLVNGEMCVYMPSHPRAQISFWHGWLPLRILAFEKTVGRRARKYEYTGISRSKVNAQPWRQQIPVTKRDRKRLVRLAHSKGITITALVGWLLDNADFDKRPSR